MGFSQLIHQRLQSGLLTQTKGKRVHMHQLYFSIGGDERDLKSWRTMVFHPPNTLDHTLVVACTEVRQFANGMSEVEARKKIRWYKLSEDKLHTRYTRPISLRLRP